MSVRLSFVEAHSKGGLGKIFPASEVFTFAPANQAFNAPEPTEHESKGVGGVCRDSNFKELSLAKAQARDEVSFPEGTQIPDGNNLE